MDLVRQRTRYHNRLTKLSDSVKEFTLDNTTEGDVAECIEILKEFMDKVNAVQDQLIDQAKDDDAVATQEKEYEPILLLRRTIRARLNNIRAELKATSSGGGNGSGGSGGVGKTNIKLPKLDLPKFTGSLEDWPSFLDSFNSAIHRNHALSNSEKMQYLRTCVTGNAYAVISSFTITDANYEEAWEALNEAYDNKREIIAALVRKLFYQKAMKNESVQELENLVNKTFEAIRSLKGLGQPIEHLDFVLTVIINDKLDPATRTEWAKSLNPSELPTMEGMKKFLRHHIWTLHSKGTSSTSSQPKQPQKVNPNQRTQFSSHHVSVSSSCKVCNGDHPLYACSSFKSMTPEERYNTVKSGHLCLNCFRDNHMAKDCPSKHNCKKCNKRHNTQLHSDNIPPKRSNNSAAAVRTPQQPPPQPPPQSQPTTGSSQVTLQSNTCFSTHPKQTLLKTALVNLKDSSNNLQQCKMLLDDGSEASFITEAAAARLGLQREATDVIITGISAENCYSTKWKSNVRLFSQIQNSSFDVTLYHLPRVTGKIPKVQCPSSKWKHLDGLQLADPFFSQGGEVDILVGAEVVPYVMLQGTRLQDNHSPVAHNSIFGWIVSGCVTSGQPTTIRSHVVTCEISNILKRFWQIEEVQQPQPLTIEEQQCENHFASTHSRLQDGRFMVKLPFNASINKLGASREQALSRLLSLERRFRKYPQHKQEYIKFMREYEELKHMEKAVSSEKTCFYLPHHFVLKEDSTTTKLRVVFDGSARSTSGISINNCMMTGPTVQSDLFSIILRFRFHVIAIKADITKMYRQFIMHPDDRDYQRILWREDENHDVQEYRLSTVTYGTGSAPYLATKCLVQLASENADIFPEASTVLKDDSYVDDIMSGASNTDQAIKLVQNLNSICSSAGMELRKWCSSSREVMSKIPEHLRESSEVLSFDDEGSVVKALGIQWTPVSDSFLFAVKCANPEKLTKRHVLAETAKVFDPLGWLSPVTISAKLIMQSLWLHGLDWDSELNEELGDKWRQYHEDLIRIQDLRIPRCVITSKAVSHQVHGFCDSSERAYAAAVYLRVEYEDGRIAVNLLTSKTRVAPVDQVSLPRLELCGAKLLAETIEAVKKNMIFSHELFCWTDSTITLRWISSHSRKWKTYVANRVSAIQSIVAPEHWHHVRSEDNPADLPSRGVNAHDLIKSSLWWHGPRWLTTHEYPISMQQCNEEDVKQEERAKIILCHNLTLSAGASSFNKLCSSFSSFRRLCRATAILNKYIHFLKNKQVQRGPLTVAEVKLAELKLIGWCQRISLAVDIQLVKSGSSLKSSNLNQLTPFVDSDGILRVGGRINNAPAPSDFKHPIILPNDHQLTTLIIEQMHLDHLHSGFTLTMAALRRKYWILRGRDKVRHIIRKCITCRRVNAITAQQLMGSLPVGRVTPSQPFQHTGVDFAGPFTIRMRQGRGVRCEKHYFSIFVCFATKAIHLEAVTSLSTNAFIACFERFISRRGVPSHMYSDCGTNFVGANREMQRMLRQANDQVQDKLANFGTQWTFNASAAAHQGGLWEAGVKSVKFHFRRVVGASSLTIEQFTTLLCKIEACLNSRPITALSSDPADLEALTPGHFLIGGPLTHIPEPDLTQVSQGRLGYWEQVRRMSQHFWARWTNEYLTTLQQRFKWKEKRANVQVDDLIVVKDEQLPLTKWKLGRIRKVFPGSDGLIRSVEIQTANGQITRPINKLVPLISTNDEK